ncbi:hypothetical protein KAH94_05380 [bacterium]|nr:hypothetical protein [bacterium]
MDEKRRVGIRRGSFLKLMEDNLNITDFDTLNQIFDIMLEKRLKIGECITPILRNYVKNIPGLYGNATIDDLEHYIEEFENIVKDLKFRRNKIKKKRL